MTATTDSGATNAGVFGRVRLGFMVVESKRLADWRRPGAEGQGAHTDEPAAGELVFRIDAHQRRLIIRDGPAEDVAALGMQVDDEAALSLITARLRGMGVQVQEGSAEEAQRRGVERFQSFVGPKRQVIELFTRPVLAHEPLKMLASGFLTGAGGMGHVAITSREPDAVQAFWQQVFDARVSDYIDARLNGVELDLRFLRLNERHHSVAIAATKGLRMNAFRTQIHHLNFQASSLDDVTGAYLRCRELGFAIAIGIGIGQHPNDRELSFYVATPSGFEIEIGWNPIVVDDDEPWQPARYRGISLWGHFPESLTTGAKLRQRGRGLASLTKPEFTVATGDKS